PIFSESSNSVVDLTRQKWILKKGFSEKNLHPQNLSVDNDSVSAEKFPIVLNSAFKTPVSQDLQEYSMFCRFKIDLNRIEKNRELAFYFSGIGESWEVFLNGVKIRDEFDIQGNEILRYRTVRNAVIPFTSSLLKEDNVLLIHTAGYSPSSFLSPNNLLGLRFSKGYTLDYEKKIMDETGQISVLLLNSIYIFFGLYHLFFFIRWTQKKYNLYFGVFSLLISVYFLSFSNLGYEFFSDTRPLFFFSYASQPLAVMFFMLFIYDYFHPDGKFPGIIKYTVISSAAFTAAYLIFSIRSYQTLLFAWYGAVIPQIFYIFYFIIITVRKGSKDAVPMAVGIAVLLSAVLFEILDTVIFKSGIRILQYAFFSFIISLILILANRFIEINAETKRLNIELTGERDSFSKFVPVQFLDLLGKRSAKDIEVGECSLLNVTILFSDIRNFTSLSETMSPDENFRFINSYLKRMNPLIQKNGGFVDKFIGDAIMAIFPDPDSALSAGTEMLSEMNEYNFHRANSGYSPVRIGIGIHTGPAMMGTVGSYERMSTTVIGDTVNVAARLESLNKSYFTSLLISEETYLNLKFPEKHPLREIDSVQVKGKSGEVRIYECFESDPEDLRQDKEKYKSDMKAALTFLENGNEEEALKTFLDIQLDSPGDPIPVLHIRKCQERILNLKNLQSMEAAGR
ncbi:MAG TPA: adenylate/guanylate cyclase domain-containing protein, partial [Leptospiraceae bacterium]|nr:adenylate/guanylate cyclase domain-containing protein [Leptospiraceae bacterium]